MSLNKHREGGDPAKRTYPPVFPENAAGNTIQPASKLLLQRMTNLLAYHESECRKDLETCKSQVLKDALRDELKQIAKDWKEIDQLRKGIEEVSK